MEPDGRMFPTTDKSSSVINVLEKEAKKNGVKVVCGSKVVGIEADSEGNIFRIKYSSDKKRIEDEILNDISTKGEIICSRVILASGSSRYLETI